MKIIIAYPVIVVLLASGFKNPASAQETFISVKSKCKDVYLFYTDENLNRYKIQYSKDTLDNFNISQRSVSSIETFSLSERPMSGTFLTQAMDSIEVMADSKCNVKYLLLNKGEYYRLREQEQVLFPPGIDSNFRKQMEAALNKKDIRKAEQVNNDGYNQRIDDLKKYYKDFLTEPLVQKKIGLLNIEKAMALFWCRSKLQLLSSPDAYKKELEQYVDVCNDTTLSLIPIVKNAISSQIAKARKYNPKIFNAEYFFSLIEKRITTGALQQILLLDILKTVPSEKTFDVLAAIFF